MATGDQSNFVWRLGQLMPENWFSNQPEILNALFNGAASLFEALYQQNIFVRNQTRIATSTGAMLDITALDFLGGTLKRRPGELDASFSMRIRQEIVRPRVTREAVRRVLNQLTGADPEIFQPARATDTGGWGAKGQHRNTGLAYGARGGYGSRLLPFQFFIQVKRPLAKGLPRLQGYRATPAIGGYGKGSLQYTAEVSSIGNVTDEEIYAAIDNVLPAGTIAWTYIYS